MIPFIFSIKHSYKPILEYAEDGSKRVFVQSGFLEVNGRCLKVDIFSA